MNLGHGGNVEEIARQYKLNEADICDFSANINPLGLSHEVRMAMIESIDLVQRYPDITYYELKKAIGNYEFINPEDLVLGNGAAEVIFNITRALKPRHALLYTPTFSEYEDALLAVDCQIKRYFLKPNFLLDDEFIEAITEEVDMVFVCNPNNPTGVLTSKNYLLKVLKQAQKVNATVVVDESFLDFIVDKETYSAISLINQFDHLIVVKSLTKFFAFPGIRVGYGISNNQSYIKNLNKISVPWTVNTVAVAGAISALTQQTYIAQTIEYVQIQNEYLYNELSLFAQLSVFKGSVNFLFFKLLCDLDLKSELLKDGILIRSCANYPGLDESYYRVAVRTEAENKKLIQVLENVLS
ncbi:MAG: threonine-phosphate decarboxylase CobD [Turicibacter sp.]